MSQKDDFLNELIREIGEAMEEQIYPPPPLPNSYSELGKKHPPYIKPRQACHMEAEP